MKKKFWIAILTAVLLLNLLPGMTPSASADDTSSLWVRTTCRKCRHSGNDFLVIGFTPTPISSIPDPELHWTFIRCANCGFEYPCVGSADDDGGIYKHTGGTEEPTCTTGKPARCAALNTAFSATSGAIGSPMATTPTPVPASARAAARLKRETATAALRTAAHTALAPFAAERTSMPIILFLRAGTGALTRT